jgi:hypothetical protein
MPKINKIKTVFGSIYTRVFAFIDRFIPQTDLIKIQETETVLFPLITQNLKA